MISGDGRYLVLTTRSLAKNLVFYKDLAAPKSPVKQLFPQEARFIFLAAQGRDFSFMTDAGAPHRRIVRVNLGQPDARRWTTIVAETKDTLEDVNFIGNRFVTHYTRDAVSQVNVFDLRGALKHRVALPYIGWLVSRQSTAFMTSFDGAPHDPEAFFGMQGLADPSSVFKLDVNTGKVSVFSRPKLNYDPTDFVTEQVIYPSKDGTRVPMTLVYKKGLLRRDGTNPLWLYAYGFNWSARLFFQADMVVWMELGGVYALANIRGGTEYGHAWQEAGSGQKKQTGIDDYIAAAQWLVQNKYTAKNKLALNGGSASGPIVGAALTQRPELGGAAIVDIPLADLLRMAEYAAGPITTGWGNPKKEADFRALHSLSPYHNVRPGTRYPPTLITAGELDEAAIPLHAYKFAAALQAAQAARSHPILLQIVWGDGHAFGLTTPQVVETEASRLAFAAEALGMKVLTSN